MKVDTAGYVEAVLALPRGGKLTLYDVGWEDYELLLASLAGRPGLRSAYNQGRFEVMSPSREHERLKGLAHDFVEILGEETHRDIVSFGSATQKQPGSRRGVEADDCFYIQNASLFIDREPDPARDPAPDLLLEIDITGESASKLDIYAAFRAPEIWRYSRGQWVILRLAGSAYEPVTNSIAFPFVTVSRLVQFVEDSRKHGPRHARRALREWVRKNRG